MYEECYLVYISLQSSSFYATLALYMIPNWGNQDKSITRHFVTLIDHLEPAAIKHS